MQTCDLCGLVLASWVSKRLGRCAGCRREHGEPTTAAQKLENAQVILLSCGECPSCEQGHPERCRAISRP
jgi:hypothetical protein